MAPKAEKTGGRSETEREEKRTLINNFWTAEGHVLRNLEKIRKLSLKGNVAQPFTPNEEFLSTLTPSIRKLLMEGWVDRVPPPEWGQCGLCAVKGDMVDMFFCWKCGTAVHPNCIDPSADPVNDARLTKWECHTCVRRAEEKKGASSSARKP
jgi:hypothetical protein